MKAIIQAGGKGKRLRSVTNDKIPKPMVNILGRPLLEWQIHMLAENGIHEVFFVIGHLGQVIKEYFRDGQDFGVKITYIEEKEPMGTGGILFHLKDKFVEDEDILFLYGDIFWDVSIDRMFYYHQNKSSLITAFAHPNSHPDDSDVLVLDNESRIVNILFKNIKRDFDVKNIVNAAMYIIHSSVIKNLMFHENIDFEKGILMNEIKNSGRVFAYCSTEYVRDVGNEERLHLISADIQTGYPSKRNLKYLQQCIFIDKVVWKPKQMADAIKRLNHSRFLVILIDDQVSDNQELCSVERSGETYEESSFLLEKRGAYLDAVSSSLYSAERMYYIDLSLSWMIGGRATNFVKWQDVPMKTAIIITSESDTEVNPDAKSDMTVSNLDTFVDKLFIKE